jgi:glycosyltransferase involved in cell wall biosynthesis
MCQNMLPFEWAEASRFGVSLLTVRYILLRWSQKAAFNRAKGLICLSNYAQRIVSKSLHKGKHRMKIIPHGIDFRFHLRPRPQRSVNDYSHHNPYRFLYVSIVNMYKHQWHVAEAVVNLRQKGYPVAIDFFGPAYPPALKKLQEVLREIDPGNETVFYHGPVPHTKVQSLYHRADAFVFASSCEAMPNILVEAMASGLPIACSDRGPMPEILGNAGLYFDPEQPQEIKTALQKLVEDPDLRTKLAWEAFNRASIYSWERCADETFSFLSQVAKDFGGR